MDNETMTAVEATETTDAFAEGWDEGADTVSVEPADQPEPAAAGDSTPALDEVGAETAADDQAPAAAAAEQTDGGGQDPVAQPEAQPAQAAPKEWTLRHMDEERTVGEAEMVTLAQKGLDYDRIREKYDASKPVMELIGEFAKKASMSIPDYISHLRVQAKRASGMNEAQARQTVELEDREAKVSAREAEEAARQAEAEKAAARTNSEEARRRADIAEFQKAFPDAAANYKAIPQEVWADVRNGMSLVAAYARYSVKQAKTAAQTAARQAEAKAQNVRNAGRTTGSMKSAGSDTAHNDPFLEGWNA